jgi:hypothetical protein
VSQDSLKSSQEANLPALELRDFELDAVFMNEEVLDELDPISEADPSQKIANFSNHYLKRGIWPGVLKVRQTNNFI